MIPLSLKTAKRENSLTNHDLIKTTARIAKETTYRDNSVRLRSKNTVYRDYFQQYQQGG
jgi:hypothetical protein